jgi:hypothetical protein
VLDLNTSALNLDRNAKLSAWTKDSVAGAVNAGILQGALNNKIAPSSKATRAEAAVMLNRFLQYDDLLK